jgi:hypothetical protein
VKRKLPRTRSNSDEAGATFDAPCVTVAVWSLPPQSRAARDPFSRVRELEFRSRKTTFITPHKGERKDISGHIQAPGKQPKTAPAQVRDGEDIECVLDRHAEFRDYLISLTWLLASQTSRRKSKLSR